jgi:hypothetical protein
MLIQRWLKCKTAARYLGFAPVTISRRGLEWQANHELYRIRWMYLRLSADKAPLRRYFGPDVFAMGKNPVPRDMVKYVPILMIEPPAKRDSSFFDAQETDDSLWLRINPACEYLDVSPDVIQRRGICIEEARGYVPFHVRYEERQLSERGRVYRRYFKPDLAAWLIKPTDIRRGQISRDDAGHNSRSVQQAHPAANPGNDRNRENPVPGSAPPSSDQAKTRPSDCRQSLGQDLGMLNRYRYFRALSRWTFCSNDSAGSWDNRRHTSRRIPSGRTSYAANGWHNETWAARRLHSARNRMNRRAGKCRTVGKVLGKICAKQDFIYEQVI